MIGCMFFGFFDGVYVDFFSSFGNSVKFVVTEVSVLFVNVGLMFVLFGLYFLYMYVMMLLFLYIFVLVLLLMRYGNCARSFSARTNSRYFGSFFGYG